MPIRILVLAALAAAVVPDDEPWTATLVVKTMHCDECVSQVETQLKGIQGVKSVEKDAAKLTLRVSIEEKRAVRLKTFQAAVPADMKLEKVEIVRRGRVSSTKDGVFLAALGSGQAYELTGEKAAELAKSLKGDAEFRITGELGGKDGKESIAVANFQAKDWKD